jgi:dynactin complex subunit
MTNEEAIKILKEELDHTEQHLNFKNKAPEYYEELGAYCDAVRIAINALKENERLSLLYSDLENEIARLKSMTGERCKRRMKGGAE